MSVLITMFVLRANIGTVRFWLKKNLKNISGTPGDEILEKLCIIIDRKNYKFRRKFQNLKTKWDKNSAKI